MNRRRYTFWIDLDLLNGLREVRERDGVLESEQIRRAIRLWLARADRGKRGRRDLGGSGARRG